MNLTLISAAIAAAIGFGAAWQIQGHFLLKQEMEAKDAIINQQRIARATSERYSAALSKAQTDAQSRRTVITAAVDSNGAGLIGLRHTADSVRSSAATDSTRDAYADAVTELFDQCSTTLVRVAGEADGHVSDKQTLMGAWPR
jgi:hypothetical protein